MNLAAAGYEVKEAAKATRAVAHNAKVLAKAKAMQLDESYHIAQSVADIDQRYHISETVTAAATETYEAVHGVAHDLVAAGRASCDADEREHSKLGYFARGLYAKVVDATAAATAGAHLELILQTLNQVVNEQ